MIIPKMKIGRPSAGEVCAYKKELKAFAEKMLEIKSTIDFPVSSRGWCYILENAGKINKGDFNKAQKIINDCRKAGFLPVDFCGEDVARKYENLENLDIVDKPEYIKSLNNRILNTLENYQPISFWENKKVYIEMLVEKIDLKSLFGPICERYYIPIANAKGWQDINMRVEAMRRFKEHETAGRDCYLLYCGDHDPSGIHISQTIMDNLDELKYAADWNPCNLKIHRFGLNFDFIEKNKLLWIKGLETGSKKDLGDENHRNHNSKYVQEYIKNFGKRKVEANALVTRPEAGRKLCEAAIQGILKDAEAVKKYLFKINAERTELKNLYFNS